MIKIISADNPADFEELVNEFERNNQTFACQTHVKKGEYIAVVFFRQKTGAL